MTTMAAANISALAAGGVVAAIFVASLVLYASHRARR